MINEYLAKKYSLLIIHYSFFINRDISFGFLDGDLIAVLYMVADPARDILGRRIDVQHLVDILMIEGVLYDFLDVGEIGHHAILIQLLRLAIDDNDPVMAVQVLALAFVRQHQVMCRRNLYSFFYVIHEFS